MVARGDGKAAGKAIRGHVEKFGKRLVKERRHRGGSGQ
jgi:hypothetical protein